MFFGTASHTEREEKVLQYVIHRVNQDVRLHEVIREDYVRRNCSESEIDKIVNDPELVQARREYLWGRSDPVSWVRSGVALRPGPASTAASPRMAAPGSSGRASGAVGRRPAPPNLCDHRRPTTVEHTEWDYRVRCTDLREGCGPGRKTPGAAYKALLVLGVREVSRQRGTGTTSLAMSGSGKAEVMGPSRR